MPPKFLRGHKKKGKKNDPTHPCTHPHTPTSVHFPQCQFQIGQPSWLANIRIIKIWFLLYIKIVQNLLTRTRNMADTSYFYEHCNTVSHLVKLQMGQGHQSLIIAFASFNDKICSNLEKINSQVQDKGECPTVSTCDLKIGRKLTNKSN